MTDSLTIRPATPADAAVIAIIYNHAVEHTTAIWNDVTVDAGNRVTWMQTRQDAGFPVMVAVRADTVVGYASYGPWRAFDGYKATVEHSVYVAPDAQGGGIGLALMKALIAQARADKLHVMVAGIEAGNAASIRLHEKLGFQRTALMPQVGQKFGRWLDLAFLQLVLDGRDAP
ncbi:phosphinothricin acetyltransferase [Thalassovita litoralis]|jgi:phosphinothricin acetyltransferase|uniref:Phosphinothricin acetyltransferase n=1 Tax=Thalassovita litoralis TaxID=1010611 RepID=A0A521FM32_9RHOB|nr:GNAT family N-acetyltransferase [Thalassovita litoralis]SMO97186.1 phosphinothricin acetyltransferase [Thalassovita litoralis]